MQLIGLNFCSFLFLQVFRKMLKFAHCAATQTVPVSNIVIFSWRFCQAVKFLSKIYLILLFTTLMLLGEIQIPKLHHIVAVCLRFVGGYFQIINNLCPTV